MEYQTNGLARVQSGPIQVTRVVFQGEAAVLYGFSPDNPSIHMNGYVLREDDPACPRMEEMRAAAQGNREPADAPEMCGGCCAAKIPEKCGFKMTGGEGASKNVKIVPYKKAYPRKIVGRLGRMGKLRARAAAG